MFKLQTQSAYKRGKPVFSLLFDALPGDGSLELVYGFLPARGA